MTTMDLTGVRVSWIPEGRQPVDIPGVTKITMQRVQDPIDRMISLGMFKPTTIRGRIKLTPYGYRMLFGRTHPRIRRMRAAYRRKHGRGRW